MSNYALIRWMAAPVCVVAFSVVMAQMPPPGSPMPPSIPIGTVAPDGLGATVGLSQSAGVQEQGPWEEGSVGTPLQVGASMPADSVVQTVDGKSFDLNAAVAEKPTVLIFYRGGWCPYCNAHLRDLQKSVGALREMGYQLLAVSTDTPAALRATLESEKLDYQLLSDSTVAVAKKFGLTYKVIQAYLDHVKNDRGTDLQAQNGGYLVTPAVYVLDRKGVVRFMYANQNFTVRLKQDVLLDAARAALK